MIRLLSVAACLATSCSLAATAFAQPFTVVGPSYFVPDTLDSSGAAWADLDGDGDDDLIVVVTAGPNAIYRNDGGGRFTRITVGEIANIVQPRFGVAAADVDNDGMIDLAFAGTGRIGTTLYHGTGNWNFVRNDRWTAPTDVVLGWALTFGDYDADGFVDLAVTHPSGFLGLPATGNWLFRNRGDRTFERVDNSVVMRSGLAPYTIPSFVDYDDDGDLDLFVASGPANGTMAPDFLYRNLLADSSRAVFRRLTTGPMATDSLDGQVWNFVDIDNDGDLDGFVTNYSGVRGTTVNHLYRNTNGTFSRDTLAGDLVTDRGVSLGQSWGDYDNDGDLDVIVARTQPNIAVLYRNRGDGTFVADTVGFPQLAGAAWGVANADYDSDGDLDVFVSAKSRPGTFPPDRLLQNGLGNGNAWAAFTLVGTRSNRSAIGAKLYIEAVIDGKVVRQRRDVSAQNTFGGHNSLRVHVGLGNATTVRSVTIVWPSGQRDVHRDVPVRRLLTATEGDAALKPSP